MSLHDAYARMTPFEIAFPDADALDRLAQAVRTEAQEGGVDATDPEVFESLPPVRAFLGELSEPEAPVAVVRRLAMLVFQAVHFLAAERPLWLLETGAARRLVEERPQGQNLPPREAGYVQLPQHLFWMRGDEAAPPESIDGLFWTASPARALHVLAVSGVRPDRPGFGVAELPAAPLADASRWAEGGVREHGTDFASTLPGADIDRLYEVTAAGELLELLARFFAVVGASSPGPLESADAADADAPGAPVPSALPFTRVKLVA